MSAEIAARGDLDRLLNDLKQHAPAWIAAGEANERPRRQLAAATFALEAARAAEHAEWKWIQNNRLGPDPVSQVEGGKFLPSTYRPQPALWWKTPPLLIEWACDLLRQGSVPKPTERVWHLAAVSVAQRRSDYEFLLGSPWEVRENPKDEIEHLNHVSLRFTDEPRFALAQAVAIDWRTWPLGAKHPRTAVAFNAPDAMRAFELQLANPTTGAEAAVRLGVLRLRTRNLNGALELFARAETQTRDRYLLYLSRYFSGQARERQKRPEDAERAYRGALATIPGSISATMALSAVLVRAGRVSEATTLVEAALTANPTPVDPWRTFATADDRFWRVLLARLHDAIRPGAGDADAGAGATIAPAYMQHAETDCGSACEDDGDANEQQQQQPVFRTRTDLVTIDVSVRSQGTPIAGLTAKDFVLLDNGVPQAIEQIDMEAVPVDVSILVDLNEDLADDLKGMSEQVPRIMNLLRPDDRVRVTAINTHVGDLLPLHRADIAPDVGRFRPSGLSSAHDGLAAALLRETDPNRRHLIIALTNGIDAISALDARAVRDIARVSDATLYIAQVDVALDPAEGAAPIYLSGRERADRARCMASGVCSPTKRFWQPYGEYDFDILAEAAAMTGGNLYLPGVFTDRTAAAIFKKVFEDYRRSYVLRYTPKGVAAAGWHEVKVTIPGHAGYELQARRGYFVEAPGRAPGAPAPAAGGADTPLSTAAAAASPPTLASLIRSYGAGDFTTFVEGLSRVPNRGAVVRELRESGTPWPDQPMREAAFVLELADFALQSPRREDRADGVRILAAHRPLLRGPFGPELYERYWLWAATAVLEGANQPEAALRMIDDGLKTFPGEPRLILARAFVLDQRHALDPLVRNRVVSAAALTYVNEVSAAYDAAMESPDTAAEARIRKSWLLHRAGRSDEALALLEAAGTPQEPFLEYMRHLFRGRVLGSLGRAEEAATAFRAALAVVPNAQSARVGLMTSLQQQGQSAAALELAEQVQTAGSDVVDPWWRYWQGDYRLRASVFTRLREQGR